MRQINAEEILDITLSGTSATLLAKRWESALLVNVDNDTLERLLADDQAMKALMSIEGFRSLNADIEMIINKSEAVKSLKKDEGKLTSQAKKELSAEEKEYKSIRKKIQEKLIKFATRIPIFMYLTDYRESHLKDVITQLEPALFKKVTGMEVADFERLVSLGVFNASLMNDAIFKFKRYEDSSLSYTGCNRHEADEDVGGWDIAIKRKDFDALFVNQQASLSDSLTASDDLSAALTLEKAEENKIKKAENVKPTGKLSKKADVTPNASSELTPTVPRIDTSKVKLGCTLSHKIFGQGTVTVMEEKYMTVTFAGGEKRFQFPQAILNGFLKIED